MIKKYHYDLLWKDLWKSKVIKYKSLLDDSIQGNNGRKLIQYLILYNIDYNILFNLKSLTGHILSH